MIEYLLLDDHQTAPVGFTAYATVERQYDFGDLVIFDAISTNIGNYYNADTSIFTCPCNGLYMFSFSFNVYIDSSHMYADIMIASQNVAGAFGVNRYSSASALAVTECDVGQTVWVQCTADYSYMDGHNIHPTSHFSGVLLQAYV